MKISLNWIKQYVKTDLTAKEIAKRLTMAGLEVEAMQVIGGDWEGITVGQILAVSHHPNADRLTLLDINLGSKQETVVCGAPNVAVGAKIAYAPIGTKLIDGHTGEVVVLKQAKIRGVVSSGMACSEKELGISDEHEGILILPADTPVGVPLTELLGDVIYTIEITPNRPDCLSVTGIAREVAFLTGSTLKLPDIEYVETGAPIDKQVTVEIQDADLCPRYCASLITGIKIGESPEWLKNRLLSYGMRPINNVVDVTNFVMLEYGQPLHSFDYEKIIGRGIIVRRAKSGEKLTSLDGLERQLTRDMLVIADKERSVAVAGIMGGANTEVSENTTSILLESASFKPASVRYTGKNLGMPSEACIRFERGISSELTIPALKRATQLIVELGKGQAAKGIIDAYPGKIEKKPIKITATDVKRVLGIEFSVTQIVNTLTAEGCECHVDAHKSEIAVVAPYWRSDLNIQVDVIEEIVRVIGYESIPTTLLSQAIPQQHPLPIVGLKRKIRNMMVGYGFQELVTYSYISLDSLSKLTPDSRKPDVMPMRLMNPMSADYEYMRTSLRPNLLSALAINKAFSEEGLQFFELGKVYLPREGDLPNEIDMLCGVIAGRRGERWWQGEGESVDFFDARGLIEGLLNQLGITVRFGESTDESLHPSHQAAVVVEGKPVGVVGELHPAVAGHFELSGNIYLFEFNLPLLLQFIGHKMYTPIPKFPATIRDMALVVDISVPHQKIVDIIRAVSLVTDATLFDVYVGEQVPAGKKSMAYRLTYQSPNRTLTDEEVNKVQQQILKRLAVDVGAVLRS
jgi:phenylalanyl-tRNA synthetase beta chain